ncbi:hypothetical protein [Nocardia jiangxiensis]|uniref:hypothetical protein n=1 Tax=Nocardia jiangxiensis TaxID=282685 RepID=UPI0002DDF213|nr:hypothetical protein [Nocardia jiangxiensis]
MIFDDILAEEIDGIPDADLLGSIRDLIVDAEKSRPRSVQRELGPSGVGYLCKRRLAYSLASSRREDETPESRGLNKFSDPLPSIMGTAMHAWLEEAVRAANDRLGRVRWIPETKVTVRPGLSGTCDLYDVDTHSVLDWKVLGKTSYDKIVKFGPSAGYKGQRQLYGRGYKNEGFPVKFVGNIIISRTGSLRQTHLDREPYSDAAVDEILDRIDETEQQMLDLDVMHDPRGFKQIPIVPDDDCQWCPWFSTAGRGPFACAGNNE